jgi:hypothetical protein
VSGVLQGFGVIGILIALGFVLAHVGWLGGTGGRRPTS